MFLILTTQILVDDIENKELITKAVEQMAMQVTSQILLQPDCPYQYARIPEQPIDYLRLESTGELRSPKSQRRSSRRVSVVVC